MIRKKTNKNRYNFLLDKKTYEEFSAICDELGLIRSKKIEHFLKEFIEKNEELLRKLKK